MFPEQLRKYRLRNGFTQEQLAEIMGIAKSTISMYENGQREPDFETIEAFADIFNVNMATLVEGDHANNRAALRIPVLGRVPAGIPLEAIEEIIDYEELPAAMSSRGEFFALQVHGDSMEPKISAGDVVIVQKQDFAENGDLVVVLIDGNDATLKRYYQSQNGIKLVPSNPKYDPFFFAPEEVEQLPVRILGKVIELRAKF